jgi:hypothetical protein
MVLGKLGGAEMTYQEIFAGVCKWARAERLVENGWSGCLTTTFPYACGDPTVSRELRHAFFCGAAHMNGALFLIMGLPEEERNEMLAKLQSELTMHNEDSVTRMRAAGYGDLIDSIRREPL